MGICERDTHSPSINGDVGRTERCYCSGGGVQPNKMHVDIAVVAESCGNGKAGGNGATEGVDEHIDTLALLVGKHRINHLVVVID